MLDTSTLKSLLSHDFYVAVKERLSPELFEDEIRDIYSAIVSAQDKYQHDLTLEEVKAVWEIKNPVATWAEKSNVEDLLDDVSKATTISLDVAADVVTSLWKRHIGKLMASYALEIAEGKDDAMDKLREIVEKHAAGFAPEDSLGDFTTTDIDELLEIYTNDHRYKWNIETLARRVYGIGRGEFGILFARPETGKTAFVVSTSIGPGGFVEQGAKVLVLGNEEITKRTMARAVSAATGLTPDEIIEDKEMANQIFRAKRQDRFWMKDIPEWDMTMIDALVAKVQPDVVWIDQADKVTIKGSYNSGHERLRELYRQLRELAKRHNCAVMGCSQASADAEGKTRLGFDMLEGSKTGKAAEADLILGIGKRPQEEGQAEDAARFITISKNKISGVHDTVIVNIQPKLSRYVE